MNKTVFLIVLILSIFRTNAQDLPEMHHEAVSDFINCFKNNDKAKLASLVHYPLKRDYPLPCIKNKEEFLERYDEVFDTKLVNMIANSSLSKDWSAVGWRGIMLNNGDLWLDYDGTLMGVNYESAAETKRREGLTAIDRENIHPSLKEFVEPVCVLSTSKYRIRIDDMGGYRYRYAAWKMTDKMSEKPEIIILNGQVFPNGSGGNHYYVFKNGKYTYECEIIVLSDEDEDPAPAFLKIYKKDKEILSERAALNEL